MARFRASQGGVTARFGAAQARIVRDLVSQVAELLGADPETEEDRPSADTPPVPDSPGPSDGQVLEAAFGLTDATEAPRDPVLARLLPDAYRDDPGAAGEFRRLTEGSLRRDKVSAADRLLATLPGEGSGEVRLDPELTETWLSTINDVRLALGTRLEVTEEMAEPDPEDPDAPAYVVYLWLTELQGVLIEVADG